MKKIFTTLFMQLALFGAVAQPKKQASTQADWQQRVDHKIEALLDENKRFLRCTESIKYVNNSPVELQEIWFHVWPNAFKNNRTAYGQEAIANGNKKFFSASNEESGFLDSLYFSVNGVEAVYSFHPEHEDIIRLQLPSGLKSGDSAEIKTPFRVKIPWLFSRMGYNNDLFSITQWYPKPAVYDVNGWNTFPYLEQGEYYSEFGHYTVSLNVPANWRIAATGELQDSAELNWLDSLVLGRDTTKRTGRKTLTYQQNNVSDFAWFAKPDFQVAKGKSVLSGGREVTNYAFYIQTKKARGASILDAIDKALQYYSTRVGLYPYRYCTVVIGPLQGAGGMEYPMITICNDASEGTIIHEVGHNWFQGMLGSQERNHPWMDESINTFYQNQAEGKESESLSPGDRFKPSGSYAGYRLSNDFGCHQPGNLHSEKYTSINYGTIVYGVNPQRFLYLQEFLGRRRMDSCMQAYFKKWQYRHPLPGDMQKVFESVSGQKLDWFFRDLLGGSAPDVAISSVKRALKTGYSIKVNNKGNYTLPVKLQWRFGTQKNYIWVKGDTTVKVNQKMQEVSLNATGFLPESNLANNDAQVRGIFKTWGTVKFGLPNLYKRGENRVWFLPWIFSGNRYDGFTHGLLLSNLSFPRRNWEWWAMPLYGLKSKNTVGIAGIRRNIFHKSGPFSFTELTLNYRRFDFAPSFTTAYNRGALKAAFYFKRNAPWIRNVLEAELLAVRLDQSSELRFKKDSAGNEIGSYINEEAKRFESELFKLTFTRDYTKKLSPARIKAGIIYGGNAGAFSGVKKFNAGTFLMYNFQAEKYIPYTNKSKKNIGLLLKGYVSGMRHNLQRGVGSFLIPVSAPQGAVNDFDFSRAFFARSAQFRSNDGLWSNVTMGDANGVRMFRNLSTSTSVAGFSLQTGIIPGLPIKAYFDGAYSPGMLNSKELYYAGGICFSQSSTLNSNFELAMPLFYSQTFRNFLQSNPNIKFHHLLMVRLNLNLNDPFNLIRNILN